MFGASLGSFKGLTLEKAMKLYLNVVSAKMLQFHIYQE
jgi:hypothetical protein